MKKVLFILAIALMFCVASCTHKYEERHDTLAVSHSLMNVKNDVDTQVQMWVYYSGEWEVRLPEDCDWLSLKNPRGKGTSIIHLEVAARTGVERSAMLRVTAAGQKEVVINIKQL